MVILGFDIGAALTPDVNLLETVVRGVQLRLNGVEDVGEVKAAYLEGNGDVSVIKLESGKENQGRASRATGA